MQAIKNEKDLLKKELDRLQKEIQIKTTKINELQSCQNEEVGVNFILKNIEKQVTKFFLFRFVI